jgi:hypothetical protein
MGLNPKSQITLDAVLWGLSHPAEQAYISNKYNQFDETAPDTCNENHKIST